MSVRRLSALVLGCALAPAGFAQDPGTPSSVGTTAPADEAPRVPVAEPASPDPRSPDGKPAANAPQVKVSGVIFAHYGLDLTEGAELFNSFEIDRVYLRADAKLTEKISTRVTLDANRMSTATASLDDGTTATVAVDPRLRLFVKHAWLDFKLGKGVDVKGGLVDTTFLPFVEGYTNLRWTARTFLDDQKLESTADLGVTLSGKHDAGLVSWAAGVYDGETFTNPEIGTGKSIQGRLTVDPLAEKKGTTNLPITGFIDENLHEDGVAPKLTWAGDVGFTNPYVMLGAEVVGTAQDGVSGLGESFQVSPKIPDVAFFWGRLDHWDPDSGSDADAVTKVLAGVAHEFYDKVDLGASYERAMLESAPGVPSHGVFLRMQAGY